MYFRNYRMSKTWLNHTLKSAVTELLLKLHMVKRPKHL